MENNFQKTLSGKASLSGKGLHTGVKSKINIRPASENAGITFSRIDSNGNPTIKADVNNVFSTNRGTVLQENGVKVHTVEHVLSALYGLGIDNAIIELDGPEPPIIDGSSLPFVKIIKEKGIKTQSSAKKYFEVDEHIFFRKDDIELNILPYNHFKATFFMDYKLPNFGLQYSSIDNLEFEFETEIAPSRTFGLLSEIESLKDNGLIKGGSLDNAVVFVDKEINEKEQISLLKLFGKNTNLNFKKGSILNTEGLRFDNEPVRHKVLDLIGDLSLLGRPIKGHVIAKKSGHSTNIEFAKKLRSMEK